MGGEIRRASARDTVPLSGRWAVLHRVGAGGGAAVDSALTSQDGRYAFAVPDADSQSVYLASVTYSGITYFSTPIPGSSLGDSIATLFVFDTSSAGPPISAVERHVVIRAPEANGARAVLELLVLENRGNLTRISSDSSSPSWHMVLPPGAVNLEVGEGDVSPDAVRRRGDTLALFAPVPPGPDGAKQVVVSYLAPRARLLDLPVDQPYDRFQILLEDTLATVQSPGLQRTGVETVERIAFARFDGSVAPPDSVRIVFAVGSVRPVDFLWVVVAAVALSFAVGLITWWRRPRATRATGVAGVDELAARIAALDEAFEQRGRQATDAERDRYLRERARLKAQLAAGLGGSERLES